MTDQEKQIKRYVNEIERNLHLPLKTKARINGDIGTDIHARLEQGQSIETIMAEMGAPAEVAAGFNESMGQNARPASPIWCWLFALLGIFVGLELVGAIVSMLSQAAQYASLQAAGVGIIGGADGPTAIFVTTRYSPLLDCLALLPLLFGCAAACLLLRVSQTAPPKKNTAALWLSAAGVACAVLLLTIELCTPYASSPGIFSENLPLTLLGIVLKLFGLILPLVTLITVLRRRKAQRNEQK